MNANHARSRARAASLIAVASVAASMTPIVGGAAARLAVRAKGGAPAAGKQASGKRRCPRLATRPRASRGRRANASTRRRCPGKPAGPKRAVSYVGAQAQTRSATDAPPPAPAGALAIAPASWPAPVGEAAAGTAIAGSGSTSSTEPPAGQSSSTSSPPARFFSPSSFWNTPVSAEAPLDPTSASVISNFDQLVAAEQTAGTGPWIGTTSYSVPVYTVPVGQPTVTVRLEHSAEPALSSAWSAVPLPSTAKPASGSDGVLVLSQPSTGRMWEFWRLVHEEVGGWHASWGGAIQSASSSSGVFGTEAWPGAEPWWGVSASSLALAGGLITFEDLEHGKIEHALAMAIPGVRAGVYASPAQRSDGKSSNPLALPEGAHLRLNPSLNLTTLHLPKLVMMMAEAAQRYGIFIRDGAGRVQLFGQDPSALPTNPYTGPTGYFEGMWPTRLMAAFPWKELQLLKMELHTAK